jgi:hypothetical protein
MKSLLFFGVALGLSWVQAPAFGQSEDVICKANDYKDCTRVLKAKNKDTDFAVVYDRVCIENKGFKCVKITIRGEPNEELAYQKTQHPDAQLFLTKVGGEDKIYVLEQRKGYKPPVPKKVTQKKSTSKTTTTTSEKKSDTSSDVDVVDPLGPDVPLESE